MATKNTDNYSGVVASADCSAKQYCFAVFSGDRTVTFAGTAGLACIGVIANKPILGAPVEIDCGPIVKVVLSATITAGTKISTTNAGLAKAAVTGEHVLGILEEGGVINEVRSMFFNPAEIV